MNTMTALSSTALSSTATIASTTPAASIAREGVARPALRTTVHRAGARLLGWFRTVDRVFAGAASVRGAEVAARHNPYVNLQLR